MAACAVVFHFWSPKKFIVALSASIYGLLVITTGLLVIESGGANSPFIALWMAVSVFAGLYGIYGLGTVLALVNFYIIASFLGGTMTREDLVAAVIAGELPMFISYILWNGRESLEEARDYDVSKLNKSLEQESSKSDAVIEAIGDGVMVVSQTGELLRINPAAQKMTGWSAADATHLHFESVLKLQDDKGVAIDSVNNPISRVLNVGQQIRDNNVCVITKSGKRIYASFVVNPIGGSGEGAIAVFRDTTKERNEERAQAEFISTASHEMRTPVASIEGYLGLALNPNTATIDEKARDFITKAHASAQHLGHLFQDLLDVSRADDGRLKTDPKIIDVVEFMRDVIDGLKLKADDKGLEIHYKPDGSKGTTGTTVISPVLYVHVDKEHLREVADNLVENAIKYTLEGTIAIDVTASNDNVRISIQDSGLGIPAEDVSHLFQKFYRVDNSDTREIGGTGLGLYLCRKLIESMEGRIWVESEYKKGSTFYVDIPRVERTKVKELLRRQDEAQEATSTSNDTPAPDTALPGIVEQAVAIPTPPETPIVPATEAAQPTPSLAITMPQPALGTATSSIPAQPSAPVPIPQIAPAPLQQIEPITATQSPQPTTLPTTTPTEPQRFGAVAYSPVPQQAAAPAAVTPVIQQSVALPGRTNTPLAELERDPNSYITQRQ